MRLVCPYCGRRGDAGPGELIGRLYRCCFCGRVFVWEDALHIACDKEDLLDRTPKRPP